jgi:Baseplate J-like protein
MHQVDDAPMETLHIYVEREQPPRPSLLPIVLSVLTLLTLVTVSVLSPNQQPVMRALIRVPAVLLPPRTFTAQTPVIPTGIHAYPATTAHGTLTITNGSVISQTLPAGLTFISKSGVSVVTDAAVFVPAGSANGYGVAYISAHALVSGQAGNIPALAVDKVEGSSLYIRNLAAFQGGHDAYSLKFVTAQDKQEALIQARLALTIQSAGLHYPCVESVDGAVRVTWRCQFVSYRIPAFYHVTGITIIGKNLLLAVWFVARPVRIWVK